MDYFPDLPGMHENQGLTGFPEASESQLYVLSDMGLVMMCLATGLYSWLA